MGITRPRWKAVGDSACFWLSSCPLYLPFSDTEKDRNLSFSGAKMRPITKQKQLSEQKEHRVRLQCPYQLDHVQEAHPLVVSRGKLRRPRQHRARQERRSALGARARAPLPTGQLGASTGLGAGWGESRHAPCRLAERPSLHQRKGNLALSLSSKH